MITRDQFEAHVRAEAEREYPDDDGCPTGPYTAPSKRTIWERATYIAARMEYEWPLLEMLEDAKGHVYSSAMLSKGYSRADRLYKRIEAALSPYTTKPIS